MKLVKGEKNDSIVLLLLRFEEDDGVEDDVRQLPLVHSLLPLGGDTEDEYGEGERDILTFSVSGGMTKPSSSFCRFGSSRFGHL